MNNGRLEFDYAELRQCLLTCLNVLENMSVKQPYLDGYKEAVNDVEQFFLDKLKLKVVK